jgi:hypothetical protein
MRKALLLGVVCLLACGDGSRDDGQATPIPYRLVSGAALFTHLAPPGPILIESLTGTFVAIPSQVASPEHFRITKIAFDGDQSTITDDTGEIDLLLAEGNVVLSGFVSINGDPVEVNGVSPIAIRSDHDPPAFHGLRACGASGHAVSCADLDDGQTAGYDLRLWAVPEVSQTPLPTRTPTPTLVVTYELAPGSTILAAEPASGLPPISESLTGTFLLRVVCPTTVAPNTAFHGEITAIDFKSASFTVMGSGYIDVTTLDPDAFVHANIFINGEEIGINGTAPFDTSNYPPHFDNLEACGGAADRAVFCGPIRDGTERGFSLLIFATPVP